MICLDLSEGEVILVMAAVATAIERTDDKDKRNELFNIMDKLLTDARNLGDSINGN